MCAIKILGRYVFLLLVFIPILLFAFLLKTPTSFADGFKPNPLVEKVERVYIYLNYDTTDISSNEIPDLLNRENLEKSLFDVYQKRFSSKNCHEYMVTPPYNCNDQSVYLIDKKDGSLYLWGRDISITTSEELKIKGTLHVLVSVEIIGFKNDEGSLKPSLPLIHISTNLKLMGYDFPLNYSAPISTVFSMKQESEKTEKKLLSVWLHPLY